MRRSTRSFLEQQIEVQQLETILDAAIWAPSGGNSQTWLFTAIQNKEKLMELNELVRNGFQRWVPDDDYPGKLGIKAASQKEGYNFCYHAPTLIIASNLDLSDHQQLESLLPWNAPDECIIPNAET